MVQKILGAALAAVLVGVMVAPALGRHDEGGERTPTSNLHLLVDYRQCGVDGPVNNPRNQDPDWQRRISGHANVGNAYLLNNCVDASVRLGTGQRTASEDAIYQRAKKTVTHSPTRITEQDRTSTPSLLWSDRTYCLRGSGERGLEVRCWTRPSANGGRWSPLLDIPSTEGNEVIMAWRSLREAHRNPPSSN